MKRFACSFGVVALLALSVPHTALAGFITRTPDVLDGKLTFEIQYAGTPISYTVKATVRWGGCDSLIATISLSDSIWTLDSNSKKRLAVARGKE